MSNPKFIFLVLRGTIACVRGISHLDSASQTKAAACRHCHGILLDGVLELDDFFGT